VASPWLLLLDEPSLGLPSLFVQDIFAATRDLCELRLTTSSVEQVAKYELAVTDFSYVPENRSHHP
jgi:ABC-type branched-subunit amino acid transport system ATPase component